MHTCQPAGRNVGSQRHRGKLWSSSLAAVRKQPGTGSSPPYSRHGARAFCMWAGVCVCVTVSVHMCAWLCACAFACVYVQFNTA